MDTLISAVVWVALLIAGLKLFFWARKRNKAAKTAWRRRMGLILFFLPVLLFLGRVFLPEPVQPVIQGISKANAAVDAGLKWVIGAAKSEVAGVFSLAVTPIAYAVFYTLLGILIGWPLDALKKARSGGEEGAAKDEATAGPAPAPEVSEAAAEAEPAGEEPRDPEA